MPCTIVHYRGACTVPPVPGRRICSTSWGSCFISVFRIKQAVRWRYMNAGYPSLAHFISSVYIDQTLSVSWLSEQKLNTLSLPILQPPHSNSKHLFINWVLLYILHGMLCRQFYYRLFTGNTNKMSIIRCSHKALTSPSVVELFQAKPLQVTLCTCGAPHLIATTYSYLWSHSPKCCWNSIALGYCTLQHHSNEAINIS